jgi:hypothetical protein
MTPYEAIALAAITVLALTAIGLFFLKLLEKDFNDPHNHPRC